MATVRRTWISLEVSIEDSQAAALSYEQFTGDDDAPSNDPFDIIAQLEEELGVPLAKS